MLEGFQAILLLVAIIASARFPFNVSRFVAITRRITLMPSMITAGIAVIDFITCVILGAALHEPIPRIHDEFSYVLMSETFASGHLSNPTPPRPEFFDSFHVLLQPVYASKYFPAPGVFLAVGERLTGHVAVGLWLTSALACAAIYWMLRAWIGPPWALLGGLLMVIQYGIYSYWSQTYWGGMATTLGAALFFGAIRRLWTNLSSASSVLGAFGLVILANSRPLEGAIAALPVLGVFFREVLRQGLWRRAVFWKKLIAPACIVLFLGAAAMGTYNKAITGSALTPPYLLHEQQYQETPQFVFLPLRAKIAYSSEWVRRHYEVGEMRLYLSQRTVLNFMITAARKFRDWWWFYCGVLLSAPLVAVGILRQGWTRYAQSAVLVGFIITAVTYTPRSTSSRLAIDVLVLFQIALLWFIFDSLWERLAIVTCTLVMLTTLLLKYYFPHYFSPAACLIFYLQISALRRIWYWRPETSLLSVDSNRSSRRRAARLEKKRSVKSNWSWQGAVILLPLACAISLVLRVEARVNNWSDISYGPDRGTLLLHDWSIERANMEKWLEEQRSLHVVFVRYWPNHLDNFEWVYNKADIFHTKVMWARDLGTEHNKLLLAQFPDRTPWLVEADSREPKLIPYAEAPPPPSEQNVSSDRGNKEQWEQ